MTIDLENFIEGQYRRYIPEGTEPSREYIGLYKDVTSEKLRELFSAMHADSVYLFNRMNERLPTADETAYYWADESRGVIKLQIPGRESHVHGVLEPPSRSFRATFTE